MLNKRAERGGQGTPRGRRAPRGQLDVVMTRESRGTEGEKGMADAMEDEERKSLA